MHYSSSVKTVALGLALGCLSCAADAAARSSANIITFDAPGASDTYPQSVNMAGDITGSYDDNNLRTHGFLRDVGGAITTIDVSGAINTYCEAINNAGEIAGFYNRDGVTDFSFIRSADGQITELQVFGEQSQAVSINAAGAVTGIYDSEDGRQHGFVRAPDGSVESFDPKGSLRTSPTSINAKGEVAGYYENSDGFDLGFIRKANGKIINIKIPGAESSEAVAINDHGTVTGNFFFAHHLKKGLLGFVRTADGTVTQFYLPKSGNFGTVPLSISKQGVVGGNFYDTKKRRNVAFLRKPNGKVEKFAVKGATLTEVRSVQKHAATGVYNPPNETYHGFVRTN